MRARAGAPAPRHQPMPIQHGVHGADGRARTSGQRRRRRSRILGAPQLGILLLEPHDRASRSPSGADWRAGMGAGCGRSGRAPDSPCSGRRSCSRSSAKSRTRRRGRSSFAVEPAGNEPKTLVHNVTLLPGHAPSSGAECHPCLRNELLPLSQEGHASLASGSSSALQASRGADGAATWHESLPHRQFF